MSDEPPPLDPIAEAAQQAAAEQPEDPEARLAMLEGRLAGIEPLLEQVQANAALGTALTNYIADLREEQKFFNQARYAVGCASALVLAIIAVILFMAVFHYKSPLLKSEPHVVAAFVVAMLSGMVFIVATIAKGVFRTTVERHADGFLPPALEKATEYVGKVIGKQGSNS